MPRYVALCGASPPDLLLRDVAACHLPEDHVGAHQAAAVITWVDQQEEVFGG